MTEIENCASRFVNKVNATEKERPAMRIEGVPDSIEWDKIASFLTSLGIDLNEVPRVDDEAGTIGVVIGWNNVRCDVFARNDEGSRYLDMNTGKVATHRIHIPVVHDGDA